MLRNLSAHVRLEHMTTLARTLLCQHHHSCCLIAIGRHDACFNTIDINFGSAIPQKLAIEVGEAKSISTTHRKPILSMWDLSLILCYGNYDNIDIGFDRGIP